MNRSRITITIRTDLLRRVDNLIDGTKIKNRSHAIESLLSKDFQSRALRKAVILSGGKGVRLKGRKEEVSRILSPYKGKMFIEHIFGWLRAEGIEEAIISASTLSGGVKEEIGNGKKFGLSVSYLYKDEGTASVLRHLVNLVDDTFLMMNGDVLSSADLTDMLEFHKKCGGACTLGMISVKEPSSFGNIVLSGNRIVDFIEKPKAGKEESYLVNAGIYLMEPEIFNMVSPRCISLERDLFPALAKRGELFGYYLEGEWESLSAVEK
jgi:NDP-sugar pyrophosphorylase family protein